MTTQIQLTNINDELAALWDKELGEKKIRSSLFTCILYAQKGGPLDLKDHSQKIIKSVVAKFPCRVIVVINDLQVNTHYLKTSVSSETLKSSDEQLFCEIIQIEVAGSLIERVPFMILPHILPDLPVYLVWLQDPSTESKILPHLESIADRLIFDPKSLHDLQAYSKTVLSLTKRFHCAIGDLLWSVLSGWRSILTRVFDTQEAFLTLAQSTLIRIRYQEGLNVGAAYLQAWICSRLNWTFQSIETDEGHIRLRYKRPIGEIVFLLLPGHEENLAPGTIYEIEIQSAKNDGNYLFAKQPQTHQIIVHYSEKEFCQLPYTMFLKDVSAGEEIIQEIFYPSGGSHYKEMLSSLAQIPWSIT